MPRWNGDVDASGTPERIHQHARNPQAVDDEIRTIAREHGCEVETILWDRYSWQVHVTIEERGGCDARKALETMEAENVRELVTTDEKRAHPGAVTQTSG